MEIRIGIGLKDIVFGMSQDEVLNIWGKPDRINNKIKEAGIIYYYNDKMVKLKFGIEEAFKLFSIEIHNPDMKLYNVNIFRKSKEEIKQCLEEKEYNHFEFEEYDTFEIIYCEEICTTFEFVFDKVRSVEFSPPFSDNDERIWPERN